MIVIEVTQADIGAAGRPVPRPAVARVLGCDVAVNLRHACPELAADTSSDARTWLLLPQAVQAVREWDAGQMIEPFTFELGGREAGDRWPG